MKVLVSAAACSPYLGSEAYFGWSAINTLARDHELWVIVHRRHQAELERAATEGRVPGGMHFVFAGDFKPCHPNPMRARLQGWRDYQRFSKDILPLARELHARLQFDLAHHVTFATWRVASPLWRLGIPFVFGPIGGYEHFPIRLYSILSPAAIAFEVARMASNLASRFSPSLRASLRQAAHVFVANAETEQLARSVRGSDEGTSRLMAAFHSEARMAGFMRFATDKPMSGPLKLFAAGNMEGRKGTALALEALARAKAAGVRFHYRLGSGGPEVGHLKSLAARLGLQADVTFGEGLGGEAYQRELGSTHIYLLPSLRDSAPVTLTEAMLAGCVPVVVGGGGPEFMVTEECGYKIPVASRKQVVGQLADAIVSLDRNRDRLKEKGRRAMQRMARDFSEENYRQRVNEVYRQITRNRKPN